MDDSDRASHPSQTATCNGLASESDRCSHWCQAAPRIRVRPRHASESGRTWAASHLSHAPRIRVRPRLVFESECASHPSQTAPRIRVMSCLASESDLASHLSHAPRIRVRSHLVFDSDCSGGNQNFPSNRLNFFCSNLKGLEVSV